jgi:hypothetical protein
VPVYQVGDWYELDEELTSMLENHVLLLAKAAFDTGAKLPCKLVEPRGRRRRQAVCKRPTPMPGGEAQRIGQLGFDSLCPTW